MISVIILMSLMERRTLRTIKSLKAVMTLVVASSIYIIFCIEYNDYNYQYDSNGCYGSNARNVCNGQIWH